MAKYAPNGTLLEVLSEDEERPKGPGAPAPPSILDQLVAALHYVSLDANPRCHCRQKSDAGS